MTDTYFEIQRLVTVGGYCGQWLEVGDIARPPAEAMVRRAELRRADPTTPFRTVPFRTVPNGRPGDVTPEGAIICAPGSGRQKMTAGVILVTPEQAENAALFGWEWAEQASGGTERQTVVEIWRNEIVPADATAGGGC